MIALSVWASVAEVGARLVAGAAPLLCFVAFWALTVEVGSGELVASFGPGGVAASGGAR